MKSKIKLFPVENVADNLPNQLKGPELTLMIERLCCHDSPIHHPDRCLTFSSFLTTFLQQTNFIFRNIFHNFF